MRAAVGYLLYTCIDRSHKIFGLVRTPPSTHHVRVQKSFLQVKERELCGGGGVVAFEGLNPT